MICRNLLLHRTRMEKKKIKNAYSGEQCNVNEAISMTIYKINGQEKMTLYQKSFIINKINS